VALHHGDFWFVLFALPAATGGPTGGPAPYSRLVVVPAGPLGQSKAKEPGS
jgi:hypothetical protein